MKSFWNFYENLNEIVYAADMDTYELVYMNKKARELFHIPDLESVQGNICHKLLRYSDIPCRICSNNELKPGEFYEWTFHSTRLNRTYAMKDSVIIKNGHRYHMTLSIDITIQDQQKQLLKDFASNEAIVNEAVKASFATQNPDDALQILMQSLGQAIKCDRVYIFEKTDSGTFNNTYEWCADFVSPEKELLQDVPEETLSVWLNFFRTNRNVVIKNLEQIRFTDPLAYQTLLPQNIHSLVASPLIWNNEIIGFYGVDNPPEDFLNHISVMCQILAQFIVSILRRRDLIRRLELLSYYDQLTGARNRHAMNDFIAQVQHDKSIGLVYCDVMGLKRINDTKGHLEGDALLIRAYQCLIKHYDPNTVFRIGGDEFMIMCSNVPEEELRRRTEEMKADMSNFDMQLAIGFVWRPMCNGKIIELMKEADDLMYDDKRQYYEATPNDRRTH